MLIVKLVYVSAVLFVGGVNIKFYHFPRKVNYIVGICNKLRNIHKTETLRWKHVHLICVYTVVHHQIVCFYTQELNIDACCSNKWYRLVFY